MFQEGLRLSGVRLTRDDTLIDDIVRIIAENVRLPVLAMGDINAELAAVRIADRRLAETAARYGAATLAWVFDRILATSEARARAVVAALPDGIYRASDVIDGDGDDASAVHVQVAVRIAGDTVEVDFSGSAEARAAPLNCSFGALQSAVKTVFKALVAPASPRTRAGSGPLTVTAPAGTVFSAEKPSPTGWYYEASAQASELVWKALSPLAPHRFSAGSYMSLCVTYVVGRTPAGEDFVHIEPQHGGWGACDDADGASGLIAITDGDTFNYSVEVLEARLPLMVQRYGFNVEGGAGAGRHRGGYGLVRDYAILCEGAVLSCSFGRNRTPPWGFDGGAPGSCNGVVVDDGVTHQVPVPHPPVSARPGKPRAHRHRRRGRMGTAVRPRDRAGSRRCPRRPDRPGRRARHLRRGRPTRRPSRSTRAPRRRCADARRDPHRHRRRRHVHRPRRHRRRDRPRGDR